MKRIVTINIFLMLILLLPDVAFAQDVMKLSPFVRKAATEYDFSRGNNRMKARSMTSEVPEITAFVKTSDAQVLRDNGCRIYANWDDIYIASIPLDRLSLLSSKQAVKRIEAGESCAITNDTTKAISHVKDVWNMNVSGIANKGNGVVVGVMDIGFDLTHPTFYSADMQSYRIKQVWDQFDHTDGGEPVVGKTSAGADTIYVGRQYIGTDSILKKRYTTDAITQYHGTHTMGTAAGSGSEGLSSSDIYYSGMAPEADLCVVANYTSNNKEYIPEKERYKYTTATDMLGFKYIFDYAESVGKPCVINFSEGTYCDLYQSGIYQEVLNKMTGPGRIICAAAGNEGESNTYIHKAEGEEKKGAFLTSSNTSATYVMRSKKPVKMQLSFYENNEKTTEWKYDATNLAEFPDSLLLDTICLAKDTLLIGLMTYPSCYDKELFATDLMMVDLSKNILGSFTPVSLVVSDADNDIEVISAGGKFSANDLDVTLRDFENTHSVMFPAAADNVICVGATAYVNSVISYKGEKYGDDYGVNGIRASFSSVGPSLNGDIKPDVMAPGVNIISSMNSFQKDLSNCQKYGSRHFDYDGRTYYWAFGRGTSMSTPVVTGIVALWLQICPTLSPDQIKDVFSHSCTHYDEALTYPNNLYGYGEIDALNGLKYIQETYTGIEETTSISKKTSTEYYNINGMRLNDISNHHGIFLIRKDGKTRKVSM